MIPTLLTSPENIRYLSGFTGTKAVILKLPKKNYFFTDSRYFEEARKTIPRDFQLEIYKKGEFKESWKKILKRHRIREIHFEPDHLTYSALKYWRKLSRPTRLKPGKLSQFRAIKTQQEIRLLKQSQRINEQVFCTIKKLLKKGVSEKEIAWRIRTIAHDLKAEDLAFEPIVAFGKGTATPHHRNTNRKLKKGDIILIDMGIKYRGYCSDMTRTLFTATPTPEQAKVYETVLTAQKNAISRIRPGITGHKAWRLAADVISRANYEDYFTHGLGHGIGLNIHESPSLAEKSRDKLQEGMVMTIEPGIYLPNKFGIRIEDIGLLTPQGLKNFTKTPKELCKITLS